MRFWRSTFGVPGTLALLSAFTFVAGNARPAFATVNLSSPVYITKLHYDDSTAAGDTGECIEVTGPVGTNLSGYQLILINGATNAVYDTRALSGTIANTAGETAGSIAFEYPTNGIQNGSPDGMVLLGPGNTLIEYWSYEGGMTSNIPGVGTTSSTNLPVSETNSTPAGFSLKRVPGTTNWSGPSAGSCVTTTSGGGGAVVRTIPQIQGSGTTSPENGVLVRTTGVVSAVFPLLGGFYLQDLAGDDDATTSDGVFVLSAASVSAGNTVTVEGTVSEQDNVETSIQATSVTNSGGNLVTPETTVTLPLLDLEPFEGMKVRIQTADANRMRVAQTYFLGRYGQLTLSAPEVGQPVVSPLITPTQILEPDANPASPAKQLFTAQEGQILVLDDGQDQNANGDNPNLVPYIGCQDTPALPPTRVLRAGDLAGNLVGILDQGLINTPATNTKDYRLQPLSTASITFTTGNPRSLVPPNNGANYEIVGLNLENFFTTLRRDNGNARGAFDEDELQCQGQKLAKAICAMDPDVLGVAELENNLAAITLLASVLNTECGTAPEGSNKWVALTGAGVDVIGTDQIKVGFLYNKYTTATVGTPAVIPASVGGFNTFLGFNRPSLAQTFQELGTTRKFTAIMNHWKSKGSDCNANGDPDTGNLAGNCNLTRKSMANAMVAWIASDPTNSNDPDFLVLGDLNSYAEEDPVDVLLDAGLVDLVERDRTDDGKGYIFDGRVGTLDYGIATPSFAAQVASADTWSINSDEPKTLDYEDFFNQAGCRDCTTPFRSGDHDPISLALSAAPPVSPVPATGLLPLLSLGGALAALGGRVLARRRRAR